MSFFDKKKVVGLVWKQRTGEQAKKILAADFGKLEYETWDGGGGKNIDLIKGIEIEKKNA